MLGVINMLHEIHNAEDWANLKTNIGNASSVPDAV